MSSKNPIKNNIYFLIKDILSCFPDKFENHFLGVINNHLIVKEITKQILIDEVKEKKPSFRILAGALILQNTFLRQMQRTAIYEVIEIINPLKYCLYSRFKSIKKLGAEILIRLFTVLYFEYFFMPGKKVRGQEYVDIFKKTFSINDVLLALKTDGVFPRFIFENHMYGVEYEGKTNMTFNKMLKEFYTDKK